MAHFAEIGSEGQVLRVVVIDNRDVLSPTGEESELIGREFCQKLWGGVWVQTSYNANMRKNFAGVGFIYDSQRDAFIPPRPYASWVINESTCRWEAPTPIPTDGKSYYWDEVTASWVEATLATISPQ